jgi:CTP synthase
MEGKMAAIQYCRENNLPYLGLCVGLHCAMIEFARNVCGMAGANSTEFNPKAKYPVIYLMPGQRGLTSKGHNMRLGDYPCVLKAGSVAARSYGFSRGRGRILERHRHRYEVNQKFLARLEASGLVASGASPDGELIEIVELRDHPFFVATQFHPEFKSRPLHPHPLFRSFVGRAYEHSLSRARSG